MVIYLLIIMLPQYDKSIFNRITTGRSSMYTPNFNPPNISHGEEYEVAVNFKKLIDHLQSKRKKYRKNDVLEICKQVYIAHTYKSRYTKSDIKLFKKFKNSILNNTIDDKIITKMEQYVMELVL